MDKQGNNAKVWLLGLTLIAMFVLYIWLVLKFPIASLLFLVSFPIISFMVYKRKFSIFRKEIPETIVYFVAFAVLTAFLFFVERDRHINFYASFFVNGRIVEREVWMEPDDGSSYLDWKEVYVASSSQGQNALKLIRYTLYFVAIASVFLTYCVFKKSTVSYRTGK